MLRVVDDMGFQVIKMKHVCVALGRSSLCTMNVKSRLDRQESRLDRQDLKIDEILLNLKNLNSLTKNLIARFDPVTQHELLAKPGQAVVETVGDAFPVSRHQVLAKPDQAVVESVGDAFPVSRHQVLAKPDQAVIETVGDAFPVSQHEVLAKPDQAVIETVGVAFPVSQHQVLAKPDQAVIETVGDAFPVSQHQVLAKPDQSVLKTVSDARKKKKKLSKLKKQVLAKPDQAVVESVGDAFPVSRHQVLAKPDQAVIETVGDAFPFWQTHPNQVLVDTGGDAQTEKMHKMKLSKQLTNKGTSPTNEALESVLSKYLEAIYCRPDSIAYLSDLPKSFDTMGLSENLLKGIREYGFVEPILMQRRGIVPFCAGENLILESTSPSGKTVTLCLGILQRVDYALVQCQALVLVPDAANGEKIAKLIRGLGVHLGIEVHEFTRGTVDDEDGEVLFHVAVATPDLGSRLFRERSISSDRIKMIVVSKGETTIVRYVHQVLDIFKFFPSDVQVCCSSTTLIMNPIRALTPKPPLLLLDIAFELSVVNVSIKNFDKLQGQSMLLSDLYKRKVKVQSLITEAKLSYFRKVICETTDGANYRERKNIDAEISGHEGFPTVSTYF
ncbi:hypothetical protein GIB67_008004 [Kingdonia uniflora]|uniref:RNA helicase n=1 Tax=Kingdonia uniflora TaxID=39325 RepID=A0A7J7N1Z8_9MAGN|nr:hypothetical protein GIB67_008004 [Kingdonia uniflora]